MITIRLSCSTTKARFQQEILCKTASVNSQVSGLTWRQLQEQCGDNYSQKLRISYRLLCLFSIPHVLSFAAFFLTVFLADSPDTKFSCPEIKTLTKVTLKGGLKAGDFTDTGKVGSIKECYATCCQQSSCNLAFMLGQNCFSVKCYSKDLCSTIPAQPSIFNPQIAYVWERKELKSGE